MESKIKHLEFVQKVITRMNTNSFFIKGWATTLVSAIFALAAKDANQRYIYITLFVIPLFWLLDGFFLSQEMQYRKLYEYVAKLSPQDITFDMNAKPYGTRRTSWIAAIFSRTLLLF